MPSRPHRADRKDDRPGERPRSPVEGAHDPAQRPAAYHAASQHGPHQVAAHTPAAVAQAFLAATGMIR